MKDAISKGFERWLRSVTLKPSPPELRGKILKAAADYRERKTWTTPLLRRWLAVCAAVVLVVSVADWLLSGAQRSRLIALGGGPRPSPIRPDDEAAVLAEVLEGTISPKMLVRETTGIRRRPARKPVNDDLVQLELLMEETHESQKSPH